MKKLTTAALLFGGAILVSQSALGQFVNNDLYMGFQNQAGGGTEDYIINLGAASGIVGSSSVVDLSSDFSLSDFNAVLGTSTSLLGGVVAGSNNNQAPDLYATQFRSGGAGIPSVPGSSSPELSIKAIFFLATVISDNLHWLLPPRAPVFWTPPSHGKIMLSQKTPTALFWGTWASIRMPRSALPLSFTRTSGITATVHPLRRSLSPTKGYFTLDLTGSSPSLTFTPAAVPEPTVLGLLGGAGLLLLSFRRRLGGKNA